MDVLRIVLITVMSISIVACGGTKSGSDKNTADSVRVVESRNDIKSAGEEHSVYGVAIDRAMNSIVLLTIEGDTMSFEYPDVEENYNLVRCNIGDSVTVKFIRTDYQDSVTAVLRGKEL